MMEERPGMRERALLALRARERMDAGDLTDLTEILRILHANRSSARTTHKAGRHGSVAGPAETAAPVMASRDRRDKATA